MREGGREGGRTRRGSECSETVQTAGLQSPHTAEIADSAAQTSPVVCVCVCVCACVGKVVIVGRV